MSKLTILKNLVFVLLVQLSITRIWSQKQETQRNAGQYSTINILKKEFFSLVYRKPDSAVMYLENSFLNSKDSLLLAWKRHLKGMYFFNKREVDSALFYFNSSNAMIGITVSSELYGQNQVLTSMLFKNIGKVEKALEILKALEAEITKYSIENKKLKIDLYRAYGNCYNDLGVLDASATYYVKALDLLKEKEKPDTKLQANITLNLGELFVKMKEQDKALAYFREARELCEQIGFKFGVYACDLNIVEVINVNEDVSERDIARLTEAVEFFDKNGIKNLTMQGKTLLGKIWFNAQKFEKAEVLYNESLELAKSINSFDGIVNISESLGEVKVRQGKKEEALKSYLFALEYTQKNNNTFMELDLLKKLSELNSSIGKYKESEVLLNRYITLNDSLNLIEKNKFAKDLETRYQTAKKEQEIILLNSQNDLVAQQKKSQRNLFLVLLGLVSVVALSLFMLYKNRQKTTKKLREVDALKSKMFTNLSHEFRTPLTVIQGLSKNLEKLVKNHSEKELAMTIYNNASMLNEQLKQILAISSLDKDDLQFNYIKDNVVSYTKSLCDLFQSYAVSKGQTIDFDATSKEIIMDFDPEKMQTIVQNLLSNALKFNTKGGTVKIMLEEKSNQLKMTVSDSGIGISKENIGKIFNRFYTTSTETNTEGTGIGLALVKELVEKTGGNIEVKSTLNEGATFTIWLPITKKSETPTEKVVPKLPFVYNKEKEVAVAEEIKEHKRTILVVEDNKDILLFYKQMFKERYNLLTATNGKEALECLNEKEVDLIISDLAMPEMDGFEFSKELKEKEETSHIPLIIVSANVTTEAKLKGYDLGVDSYLTKPFKEEELEGLIKNLFKKQEEKTSYFSNLLAMKNVSEEDEIRQVDVNFIKKVQELSLQNTIPSTEELAALMNMSRSKLNHKIKTLTGKTVANYIKHIKIEKAKELLKKSSLQISEIGFQLGYNDPSLFSKVFKKKEGVTPKEYKESLL